MTVYAKKTLLQSLLIVAVLVLIIPAPLSWADSSSTIQTQVNPATKVPTQVPPNRTVNSAIKQIPQCGPDEIGCSKTCVNPKTDHNNCGACGHVCPSDQICNQGGCACPSGLIFSGGKCVVDLQTDKNNCGTAGHVCPNNQVCGKGVCTCASGLTLCSSGGNCLDLLNNNGNCGACGRVCGGKCSHGVCTQDK